MAQFAHGNGPMAPARVDWSVADGATHRTLEVDLQVSEHDSPEWQSKDKAERDRWMHVERVEKAISQPTDAAEQSGAGSHRDERMSDG